jgi:hypothetical protein
MRELLNPGCGVPHCQKPAAGSRGMRPLCPEHFIAQCYADIEECADRICKRPWEVRRTTQATQHFLNEIADQLFALAHLDQTLTRLDRVWLLEILEWIIDLHSQIQCSSVRMAAFTYVQLADTGPGERVVWRN